MLKVQFFLGRSVLPPCEASFTSQHLLLVPFDAIKQKAGRIKSAGLFQIVPGGIQIALASFRDGQPAGTLRLASQCVVFLHRFEQERHGFGGAAEFQQDRAARTLGERRPGKYLQGFL